MKVMADCCTLCQILRCYHDANHACPKRKHENSGPEFPGFSFNMVFPQKRFLNLLSKQPLGTEHFSLSKPLDWRKQCFTVSHIFAAQTKVRIPTELGPIWVPFEYYMLRKKKNGSLCSCRPRHSGSTGLPSPGKTWSGGLKPALLSIVWLGIVDVHM